MSPKTAPQLQDLVQGSLRLASPPLIYERLVEVINHPRGGPADVAKVIREDSALTARLLKVVNSAFFSFPRRIDTVSQAVTVVGTSQVRDLALATSVVTLFKDIPPDLADMDGFWRHSLACGVGARVLAGFRRESNVERFFVAGILHDVGKLVLYLRAPEEAREAMETARESAMLLHKAEWQVLGSGAFEALARGLRQDAALGDTLLVGLTREPPGTPDGNEEPLFDLLISKPFLERRTRKVIRILAEGPRRRRGGAEQEVEPTPPPEGGGASSRMIGRVLLSSPASFNATAWRWKRFPPSSAPTPSSPSPSPLRFSGSTWMAS